MSEKLCIFCEQFYINPIVGICETCGLIEGGIGCRVGHFFDRQPSDEDDFRTLMLRACTCPDYEQGWPKAK